MAIKFETNGSYSFRVYPSGILGENFSNVSILIPSMTFGAASRWGVDLRAKHVEIYGLLPPGIINDPTKYDYTLIRTRNGDETILGLPWIIESSVVKLQIGTHIIRCFDSSPGAEDRLRAILTQGGIVNFEIEFLTQ